jgi:hypothetical protein
MLAKQNMKMTVVGKDNHDDMARNITHGEMMIRD